MPRTTPSAPRVSIAAACAPVESPPAARTSGRGELLSAGGPCEGGDGGECESSSSMLGRSSNKGGAEPSPCPPDSLPTVKVFGISFF